MEQKIGCIVIITNQQNQVLLGKRENVSYRSGYFGLPGGRIEVGEKLVDCVIRELKEEVNIIPTKVKYVSLIKEYQVKHDFIHFVFRIDNWKGDIINTEPEKCGTWGWYDIKKLPQPMFPGHEKAIELYYTEKT